MSEPRRRRATAGVAAYDVSDAGFVGGLPLGVRREFERRGELVTVQVEVMAGSLEDLRLLLEHRHGEKTLSEVVQEAVSWLLAREARQIVELQAVKQRRRRREQLELEAVALSREERDVFDEQARLERALAIARRRVTKHDGG